MADKPPAEVAIDETHVRRLLVAQAPPEMAALPLRRVADGWDCEIWRLGDELAVRLPRRAAAAPLIVHEQRSLPLLAPAVEATGVRVPAPVVLGVPGHGFPWAWSVTPWFEGVRGIDVPRRDRTGWATPLADALAALHVIAPADHPINPVRGRPLATRAAAFAERVNELTASGRLDAAAASALTDVWLRGVAERPWDAPAVWVHGDLHPGNLVADGARLVAIIDFGDVTAGDPAYDLAVAWLAFDAAGRSAFIEAAGDRYDRSTWIRAHAWAASIAVVLLAHSDDNPDYARLGADAAGQILAEASPA
ncbi:aminoglycoside phosphotransferase family protein [Microbacterium sp. CFH 31415]|uniref:aminoglycoside phosphotransferase family protein n=1 Tax=Microbacterium sp. CFH 31415 TaxID=2921732 RepID=UPI001F1305BB|nr:aminoglycoside phosphotransferase family protein [Microbacterium sp. CFH 31415]MCH6229269.1 aminoglycoside phosphotransferase family protein [Microbacterium sp. CFH 31415]